MILESKWQQFKKDKETTVNIILGKVNFDEMVIEKTTRDGEIE